MTTPTTYQVPYWLGGFAVTTPAPATWTLPLTYNNGGKVQPGEFLQIRNYGPGIITLLTTPPETIDFGPSYAIAASSIVKILSNAPNWVITTPFSISNVTCGVGLSCTGTQVSLGPYSTASTCTWANVVTDAYGRTTCTSNTPPVIFVSGTSPITVGGGSSNPVISIDATVLYTPDNVKYWGARGDGVTDDCVAFNNALLAQPSVFVPPGVYIIGCSIRMSSGRSLSAAPGTATLKRVNNAPSGFNMITNLASGDIHNIAITGLTMDGNYLTQTDQSFTLIQFNDIIASNSTNIMVSQCQFLNSANGTGQALQVAGFNGVLVDSCTFTGGGGATLSSAMYFRRSSVITVSNNHIYEMGGTGIHFVSATVGELGYALTVTGNIIERLDGRGMVLSDVNGAVISNNVLNQTGTGLNSPNGEFGILVSFTNGGSNDFIISNNAIYDNPGTCIAVYSASWAIITGNIARKCGTANIMLRATTFAHVYNNILHNTPDTVLRPFSLATTVAVGLITLNGGSGSAFISQNRIQSSVPTNVSVPQYSVWTDGTGITVNLGINIMSSANIAQQLRLNSSTDQLLTIQLPRYIVTQLPTCGGSGTAANMLAIASNAFTGPNTGDIVFCDTTTNTWKRTSDLRAVTTGKVLFTTDDGVFLGTGSVLATTATGPYTFHQAWAGTPTGVPVGATAAYIPCGIDTTNSKYCCYIGAAWKCTLLT